MHGARLRRAKLFSKMFLMIIHGKRFRFEQLLKQQQDKLIRTWIEKNWGPFRGTRSGTDRGNDRGTIGEPIVELNDRE